MDKNKLLPLIESIVGFDMRHNAEIQACDLLMEIDRLDLLDKHMDSTNYPRVCLYLCGYVLCFIFITFYIKKFMYLFLFLLLESYCFFVYNVY